MYAGYVGTGFLSEGCRWAKMLNCIQKYCSSEIPWEAVSVFLKRYLAAVAVMFLGLRRALHFFHRVENAAAFAFDF